MDDKTDLILPWLPEKLESLHKQEEENRTTSILHINADSELSDQLEIVYASLDMIFNFTIEYEPQTDDELTVQFIGIRLFNSIVSCLKLLMAGYYQCSVILLRDILETGFLLDYFSIDPSKISDWKDSNEEERYKKYRPLEIRKELDNRDGFNGKERGKIYQILCEYAAHPTYPGFKLIAPEGKGKIGPFFDSEYLKPIIQELAMRVTPFTLVYITHFKKPTPHFLKIQTNFLSNLKTWAQKHLKFDLSHIDIDSLKDLAKLL